MHSCTDPKCSGIVNTQKHIVMKIDSHPVHVHLCNTCRKPHHGDGSAVEVENLSQVREELSHKIFSQY